jgi:Ca-activated chloride channel family protein
MNYFHHFAHPRVLYLLIVLMPILTVVSIVSGIRRRRALASLGSRPALEALASVSRWRRGLKSLFLSFSLSLAIVAAAGPQWGFEPEPVTAVGRDVVVVVDLSRSMLAEDVLPNRLERARHAVAELANVVQKTGGHRLGLVAFAGEARVVCPLTPDYDHFREAVADLDPNDPQLAAKPPEFGTASGTRLGKALAMAVQLHDPRKRGHQDILLLSDGDDPARDDEWASGADLARERGIPIYPIGIGNPASASPIPDATGKPIVHNEKEVRTHLEERPLEEIARVTGGVYVPARLDVPPMEEWFRGYIRSHPVGGEAEDLLPTLKSRAASFYGGSLALFAFACIIGDRPRPRKRLSAVADRLSAKSPGSTPSAGREPVADSRKPTRHYGLLLLGTLILASAAPAGPPLDHVRAGNAAFHAEDYERALDYYTRAEELITDPGLVARNKAAAYYRLGQFHLAEVHYLRALEDADGERRARLEYDLGNALLKQAEARKDDVKLFDRAIKAYQECLRDEASDEALREDAKHNLKVAQTLRAQARPGDDPGKNKDPDEEKDPPPDKDKRNERMGSGSDEPGVKEDPKGKMQNVGDKELGKEAKASRRPTPGTGDLPPIPDEDDLTRLTPAEAAEHLRRAAARILAERKERRKAAPGNAKNVLNW